MRTYYPMLVDLEAKRCLVVGGGRVAERKVTLLLKCGAAVELVSPQATPRLGTLAEAGRIHWRRRRVRPADLRGAFLVVAATDDAAINRRVGEGARKAGGLVNVVDDPGACTFLGPSVIHRGDLTIAISTGGGSPALAKHLRQRLEAVVGPEYEGYVGALKALRVQAQAVIGDAASRRALYRRAVESDLLAHVSRGDRQAVATCIQDLVRGAATEKARTPGPRGASHDH